MLGARLLFIVCLKILGGSKSCHSLEIILVQSAKGRNGFLCIEDGWHLTLLNTQWSHMSFKDISSPVQLLQLCLKTMAKKTSKIHLFNPYFQMHLQWILPLKKGSKHCFYCFLGASQVVLGVKNPSVNAGDIRDVSSIPGSGRSPGGGHGNPLRYSCLENPIAEEPGWLQSIGLQSQIWLTCLSMNACVQSITFTTPKI